MRVLIGKRWNTEIQSINQASGKEKKKKKSKRERKRSNPYFCCFFPGPTW